MPVTNDREVISFPSFALCALEMLEQAGYESWFDGGYVRNCLSNRSKGHVTVATAAPCDAMVRIFRTYGYTVNESLSDRVSAIVIIDGNPVVLTTFHNVTRYDDNGDPAEVVFVDTIREDLSRRDFTINALAYHPQRGLLDPYRGGRDIRRNVIRCVGDPEERFANEPLLALRAARFAATMGLKPDEATRQAARAQAHRLSDLPVDRIRHQMDKLLVGSFVHDALMDYFDVIVHVLPELAPMRGFDQRTRYHKYDVLEHTAYVVQHSKARPFNRWAALLHDSGKPDTFTLDERGTGHMHGHPKASCVHLASIARRLKFPKKLEEDLALVILHHDDRPATTKEDIARLYGKLHGSEFLFRNLCDLMRADSLSKADFCRLESVISTNELEALFDRLLADGAL